MRLETSLQWWKISSSFPAWTVCPCFASDPAERADAAEGTLQHTALAAALAGDDGPLAALSPDARQAVEWAAGYVRNLAGSAAICTEQRVAYTAPDGFAPSGASEVYHGTADVILVHPPGNLADLVDYKSGAPDRDHRPQLAGYALARFSMRSRLKTVRGHVLYGRARRVNTWAMSQAEAAGVVWPILEARRNSARTPVACEYCAWCRDRILCPALTGQVESVARVHAWEELAPVIREPGAMTNPVMASRALTLARFVSTWAEAVRARATELAKGGALLPGYRLQERRGVREVTDLDAAFARTGLSQGQFVSACKLSLPKLADTYAVARGLAKAAAVREIETTLADLIREGPPTMSLVADRQGDAPCS